MGNVVLQNLAQKFDLFFRRFIDGLIEMKSGVFFTEGGEEVEKKKKEKGEKVMEGVASIALLPSGSISGHFIHLPHSTCYGLHGTGMLYPSHRILVPCPLFFIFFSKFILVFLSYICTCTPTDCKILVPLRPIFLDK